MLENLKLRDDYDGFLFLAESARNPPKLRSHHHIELELNLVVRGSISYVVRDRRYTFPRGSLLWFFPAQEHQLVDRTNDAQYYVVVFKPSLIERSCRGAPYEGLKRDDLDGVLHTILEPGLFDLVSRTMDAVMEGSLDPDILNREGGFGFDSDFCYEHGDPDALNAGLHHLLLLCWRYQQKGGEACREVSLHPAICKALRILSEVEEDAGLEKLAKRCGVSPAYLSRVFSREVGVPLNRYRNAVRLSRFWEYYRGRTKMTITEAVYASGFGSYAQFYKVFSEAHGRGPRKGLGN